MSHAFVAALHPHSGLLCRISFFPRSETSHSFFSHSFFQSLFHTEARLPHSLNHLTQSLSNLSVKMKSYTAAIGLAALATQVAAHGYLTSPKPRMPGAALTKACGSQVFNMWNSDINGNVQTALQTASNQNDYDAAACNIWLCKGMKFDDNTANVQSYTAGEKVPITFNVAAPHTGTANMSVIDTKTNSIIGSPLITFDDYASTATGVTAQEKNFDITIPSDLGSKCATAGDCVLQFWWDARSIDQTYESCIDFTVGGSGSAPAPGNDSSSAPASSAPASSAPAATATAPSSSTPAATSAAASASPSKVENAAPSATSAAAEAPSASATASAGSGSGSGSTLPQEFTVQEFISWLKTETGTASAKARRHARAFF